MPRPKAPCGTYPAYRRHLREGEDVDSACRKAQIEHDRTRSTGAPARLARQTAVKAVAPLLDLPEPMEPDAEEDISRLEVLRKMLAQSQKSIDVLMDIDPARVYLLMREQREIVREIAEIQGNGQVKVVTLADQLADARARRLAGA